MLKRTLKFAAVGLLILVPWLLHAAYQYYTRLPETITMATGPAGGEWHQLSQSLQQHVERETGIRVLPVAEHTAGAMQHLELLNEQQVDFALYLRGAQQFEPRTALEDPPLFVCNLYSNITLLLIRRDLHESGRIRTLADLQPLAEEEKPIRIAVGRQQMGEYRVSVALLTYYFGANWQQLSWLETVQWSYDQIEAGFAAGKLDAALISSGHQAPIFRRLLEQEPGLCKLGEIPEVEAIIARNVALQTASIPRGLFRFRHESLPPEPMPTVCLQTILLSHEGVSARVVEAVLRVVGSDDFMVENQLLELSREGYEAARRRPEFRIHPGALSVYEPHLKPLVDPEVIDSTENLRSFAVSLLIAAYFAWRWWRKRCENAKAHRLDDYIASLLEIDRTQPTAAEGVDAKKLQKTLDRVTSLRNKALREFSAKDFTQDSAADSFLSLCDTVASGINARILQLQLEQGLRHVTGEGRVAAKP